MFERLNLFSGEIEESHDQRSETRNRNPSRERTSNRDRDGRYSSRYYRERGRDRDYDRWHDRNYDRDERNHRVENWRDSYDYRNNYIRKNPGFAGQLYFCGYCGRPIKREDMQVDHIIPPSRFAKKTYEHGELQRNTSLVAELLNHSFDLVPACAECNRRKSDKLTPLYVAKGFGSKALQSSVWMATSAVGAGILLGAWGLNKGLRTAGKIATRPLKPDVPREAKFIYIALVIALVLAFILFR